jgi:uncharacterized lipoprotein YddW (UPF0748 family)
VYKKVAISGLCAIMWMLSVGNTVAQQTNYVEEVRGVWVTNVASPMLYNKDEIAKAMNYLAENGINVVFPVVWNKGVTQYRSQIMKDEFGMEIEDVFIIQNRDPLAELIVEAHRNGMEVIPWFEFGFATSFSQNGGHILQKYPHWGTRNSSGQLVVKNGFDWMNGLHPEVQDFMSSLIHEVIDNYDIDGIQGDDRLPAMPSEAGYDAYTVELYKSEHGGASPPTFSKDNAWLTWRARKLTNYLGRVYNSVKEKDENLIVSMSPSHYSFSLTEYLQDPPRWLDSSYVDMIHPQLYPNQRTAAAYLQRLRETVGPEPGSTGGYIRPEYRHKLSPGMLIRVGSEVVAPNTVRMMVQFNRDYGVNGEVYFFYEGMGAANSYLADTLKKYFYDEPAILPFREGTLRRPKGTIVNETDAGAVRTGSWQAIIPSPTPDGYEGRSLRSNAGSNSQITYNMEVPYDAWYRVFTYIPYNSSSADIATTTAKYTVYYNDGQDSTVTSINQRLFRNRGWMPIGNVYLKKGTQPVVRVRTNDITDGNPIFVDAVMLLIDRKKSPDVVITVPTSLPDDVYETTRPVETQLHRAYPNPFNPTTVIRYRLEQSENVRIAVYDILGREVAVLVNNLMPNGEHQVTFDATNMASGVYIYRMETATQVFSEKMVLVK